MLIVDECRKTGSISEALMALISEKADLNKFNAVERICGYDSFIPLGSAAYEVLPSSAQIVKTATQMVSNKLEKSA